MSGHDLRHLAVIVGTAPDQTEDAAAAVHASCRKAAEIARESFALVPGLRAFSWLDPGLDTLLAHLPAPVAAGACTAGARALALAAAELGLALRLCGRTDNLPRAVRDQPARAEDGRTLLWFQRYSGRDEIVRAAGRFLAAHPGRTLADDELDAWLDTAGIPDPDLLLSIGGSLEPRDALLWQGSYAEICHAPGPMSAFSAADLRRAAADYFERQRRFGR
ncbi:MAG: undecaprenyl diphosphate synthase family protein [Candidatus Methylomirabilia bacterium]